MIRRIHRDVIAGLCVLAMTGSYIGYDLLRASHQTWPKWWSELLALFALQSQAEDVIDYVSFRNVDFNEFEVVTGTRYDHSDTQNILQQWCYLGTKTTINGELKHTVNLATIDGKDLKKPDQFTAAARAHFQISTAELRALTKSHCKFK